MRPMGLLVNMGASKIIRWVVGTTLASASLAFTIAKFVHQASVRLWDAGAHFLMLPAR
jgi:hypothetical protein